MITLKPYEWELILQRIRNDYPVSVWAIRWKQREVMGFTVRSGEVWTKKGINRTTGEPYYKKESCIYLDFFNDAKETFFRLKYL